VVGGAAAAAVLHAATLLFGGPLAFGMLLATASGSLALAQPALTVRAAVVGGERAAVADSAQVLLTSRAAAAGAAGSALGASGALYGAAQMIMPAVAGWLLEVRSLWLFGLLV
jgi:hypothetical protein